MDKPNAFGYFYACPNSPQLSQFTPVDGIRYSYAFSFMLWNLSPIAWKHHSSFWNKYLSHM